MDMDDIYQTELDRETIRERMRLMNKIALTIAQLKPTLDETTVTDVLLKSWEFADRLRALGTEPQKSLPDLFVWLMSGQQRLAYQRINAADILYSVNSEERGMLAGRLSSFFLKVPGKTKQEKEDYNIWAHVTAYLWLDLNKNRETCLEGLPGSPSYEVPVKNIESPKFVPPLSIFYKNYNTFEVRCHIFQARDLTPADETGLSDPFVRVLFMGETVQTKICEQTVNPMWDQTLVIPAVRICGKAEAVSKRPPDIVVQIYDFDDVGVYEFIGQTEVLPVVKTAYESYTRPKFPPTLQWISFFKGKYRVGDILAAFELIHLEPNMKNYPKLEVDEDAEFISVPRNIRPVLVPYRLEVLFWGLRDMQSTLMRNVDKPRVEVEVAGIVIQSSVIPSFKKEQNFTDMVKSLNVLLPRDSIFRPPVTIRCLDCKSFGRSTLIGTHVINSIDNFVSELPKTADTVIPMEEKQPTLVDQAENPQMTEDELREVEGSVIEDEEVGSEVFSEEESEMVGPPPPSMADLANFHDYEPVEDYVDYHDEEANQRFFASLNNPDEAEDPFRVNYAHQGSTLQMDSLSGIEQFDADEDQMTHPRATSPVSTVVRSEKSNQVKKTTSTEALSEAGGEVKPTKAFDTELGSTTPLRAVPIRTADEDEKGKKKKSKKEEEPNLDWWSRYYASVKDKEEEKMKLKLKPRKRVRKRDMRTAVKFKAIKTFNKTVDLVQTTASKWFKRKKKQDKSAVPVKKVRVAEEAADRSQIARLEIFECELENVPLYRGFANTVQPFILRRGKKTFTEFDEKNRCVGIFKGNLRLCKIQRMDDDVSAEPIFFTQLPDPTPQTVCVRVYVIKANNLRPADSYGKADPYLAFILGKNKVKDKANRCNNKLNPIFAQMYEFETTFPPHTELTIQVWDWDRMSADDFMGETVIDLEQRWLSRCRPICGLPKKYDKSGYNAWRDYRKPSQLLTMLCKNQSLNGPYYKPGQVTVDTKTFVAPYDPIVDEDIPDSETVALYALNHWVEMPKVGFPLVPEHVERRPLYNAIQPGVEQGNLDMWVDIFPKTGSGLPPAVSIVPRKPKKYELRVIIWNTEEVILDDVSVITGTGSVDQYIKGYMIGPQVDCHQTDVHYRSLNGEGMFNWRFVFKMEYLDAEEKILHRTKAHFFSLVEHEEKLAPKLYLQVWDADTFSADDYLGALVLDLTKFPKGSKSAKTCSLEIMDPEFGNTRANLFKIKRTRSWWPFTQVTEDGQTILAGKVDLELHLMNVEEAEKRPVGEGREAPEPLTEPQRPETSFAWFSSPLKFFKYSVWQGLRYKCLLGLIILLGLFFAACFLYTLPEAVANKIVLE